MRASPTTICKLIPPKKSTLQHSTIPYTSKEHMHRLFVRRYYFHLASRLSRGAGNPYRDLNDLLHSFEVM